MMTKKRSAEKTVRDIRMVQRYAHLAPEHLACYAGNISGLKGVNGTLLATPGKITA